MTYLLLSKYNLNSQKFVNVAGLVFPVDPMQGADPLKASLFDQVLHGQVILMGVDSDGLDVIEAAGEVVDHCLVELRSIAVTSVVRVDGHPVDGNVVIRVDLPVPVQLIISVVRRGNNGQGPDCFPIVGLGQVGIAILDVLADVVRVRVVPLPLVNPAYLYYWFNDNDKGYFT